MHHARHRVVFGGFSGEEPAGLMVSALEQGDFVTQKGTWAGQGSSPPASRRLQYVPVDTLVVRRMVGGCDPGAGKRLLKEAAKRLKESGSKLLMGES